MSRIEDFKNRMNNLKLYKNTTGKGYWDWKAQLFAGGGEVKDNNSLITDIITNTVKYAIDNGHTDTVKAMLSNRGGIKQTNKLFYKPESGVIKPILDLYDAPIIGDALSLTDAIRNAVKGEWYNASLSFLDAATPGAVFTKGTRLNWKDWGAKKKYIPEYEAIEKEAKKNGTWLKNEDGTDFTGDAREWVVKRSKNFKEAFGKGYKEGYTGMRNTYDPSYVTDTYLGSKDRAYTYTLSNKQVRKKGDTGIAKLVVPETDTYTVDALGNDWLHLTDKSINPYNFTNTNLIASNITTPTISFKNIRDDGPFGMRDIAEDQFLVKHNVPKKSVLYNNGDFDLSNPDIFKTSLAPYIGYKLYNKANRDEAQRYLVGGEVPIKLYEDNRTDHPVRTKLNLDLVLSMYALTDRINHVDPNTGEYNPFYKASEDTYGTVPLPEVTVTAPWTQKGRNNAAARRGMHYVLQGLEDAAKVAAPIVAGAVLPAMASTSLLGKAVDLASVAINPIDPLNYLPYTRVVSKIASHPALLPIYELGSKIVRPYYTYKRNQKIKYVEDMIDKVNKWGARYKYSKIPKSSAKNPEIAEELIKQRLVEHNTFARGVRDDYKHREELNALARKHFNLSDNVEPSMEQRLQVAATYYAPKTGSGRAGFTPSYEGEGSLYTSNSIDTAKAYAMQNHRGEHDGLIAIVNRPIDFSLPMDTWLLQADMPFINSPKSLNYSTKELPFLIKTGQSINTIAKLLTKPDIPYEQIYSNIRQHYINKYISNYNRNVNTLLDIKTRLLEKNYSIDDFYIPPIYDIDNYKLIGPDILIKNPNTAHPANTFFEIMYNLRTLSRADYINPADYDLTDLIKKYNKAAKYVYSDKFVPLGKSIFNKDLNTAYSASIRKRMTDAVNENKTNLLSSDDIDNPYVPKLINGERPEGTSNMITSEQLRTSTRGLLNAYLHFIFTGPEKTQALDFVKFIDPSLISAKEITRLHHGESTYGLSRKSK